MRVIFLCWLGFLTLAAGQALRVSALHPLMADLAKQVGGERVEVYDLVGAGNNPHRFEPRPEDLKRMQTTSVVLAAGKHMEPYLDRLEAALKDVKIVDVGRTIPSLTFGKEVKYACCPVHGKNPIDPHWWHGIDNTRRAARVVAEVFAEQDPAGKEIYFRNAANYGKRLEDLKSWAKRELSKVPRDQRKLVTEHHAFGYFAKEFGYDVIAVAGANKEQNTTPQDLAETIAIVRQSGVKALFPEQDAAAKSLQTIASATGAKIAESLISEGNGSGKKSGFKGMIHHNVNVITRALTTP